MATIRIKRRESGGALVVGTAPLATGVGGILGGEPVYDEIADILYAGKGNDGSGNSTSIVAIGGSGAFVAVGRIGAANGVAALDGTGKLPASQLPASIVGAMVYQGVWNASTNTPTFVNGTGTKGYYYKVSVAGSTSIDGNTNWNVGDMIVFDGTTWDKIDGPAEAVNSVAGRIGAVTLTTADFTDGGATGRSLFQTTTIAAAKTLLAIATTDVSGFTAAAAAAAPVQTVAGRTGTVTIAAADITDGGAVGRTLLQATTAAAAKTILAITTTDVSGFAAAAAAAAPVQSVAGRTGAVTIAAADITDGGTVGRTLLQAATAAAAKTILAIATTDVSGFTAAAAAAAPVQTVAGRTGAVTLTHNDITDWTSTLNAAFAAYSPTAIDGGVI